MRLKAAREDMGIKAEGDDQYQASYLSSWRQNPRIVRVSRTSGGKDRHSKVCTVRGLRDRRIRLSATTAIQLYDLQDRLKLSQPSKVIDWLLEAAKNDVDLLPPLQFPPRLHPNLAGESFPGIFGSSHLQGESLDILERRRSCVTLDQSSNFDRGFDVDHHYFSNSNQSNKLCNFPTESAYDNLGHLQQSLQLDQSGNVTVAAFSNNNNNLNPSAAETMSSLLIPRYPSFLGGAQLQLFSSNSNSSKQTDIMSSNSKLD